jgi:hypothetical protein
LGEPAELNPGWRKSSYSNNGGVECVEVGAIPWRKSSYSNHGNTECVEAGHVPGAILVRDTAQHGRGPVLRLAPADWGRLTGAIRAGEARRAAT